MKKKKKKIHASNQLKGAYLLGILHTEKLATGSCI